ncbi:PQQ-dependent sugar dehydrogenase [Aeromicrobium phragmitis]|uniref:PQQ-dependent sugar dehydrogenase n=2 Tax=Aeromicrobium phragmitis TaxID=2478914 RepID=A0A3L8PKZ5_9ACTN|nr:PQQ-dependent sugar dehydrogenase [Aeromicrobium phragmitis]
MVLAACGGDGEQDAPTPEPTTPSPSGDAPQEPRTVEPRVDAEVATDLNVPWDIVFLDDGSALVTQRDAASVVRVSADGSVTDLGEVPGVQPGGEGGLQGLAITPDESTVFAYLTSPTDNRVVRMSFDGAALGEPEPILTGLAKAQFHQGGALLYDADEDLLFVAVGDAAQAGLAQDTSSLNGKILRIDTDGNPAPGNPFGNEVWSYGHRNVEGLAFDSEGRLWASEFGDKAADELNLIESGGNYGWPEVEGASDDERFVAPKATWSVEEASPAGLAIVGDTAYLGALRGQRLLAVPLDGENVGTPVSYLVEEFGRIRAAAAAPDGTLWISTSNTDGRIASRDGDDRLLRLIVQEGLPDEER